MSGPLEHKVSITQDTQLSRERRGRDRLYSVCLRPNQRWAQVHITAQSRPFCDPTIKKFTCGGLAWRRGDDGGGTGGSSGGGGSGSGT